MSKLRRSPLLLVALGFAAGFAEAQGPGGWIPPERVLFVVIDTLRPDHLGCYGYDRPTSPTLDALARDGALFLDARSTSSWTKPAVASLFSGVDPRVHGVEKGTLSEMRRGPVDALPRAWVTLAETFQQRGFATIGFCANPHVAESTGLAQGFDRLSWGRQRGDGLLQDFLAWLAAPYDWNENAWRRMAASSENLLKDWRKPSPVRTATSTIAVEVLPDRAVFRRDAAADGEPVTASLPLGRVPASASGPRLLALRALRDGPVRAKVLASSGSAPEVPLLDTRFSLLEDRSLAHRVFELEGGQPLELDLEVTLFEQASSFQLEDVLLVPEFQAVRARRWFAYLHFMQTHLPYRAAKPHLDRFPPRPGPPRPLPEKAVRAIHRPIPGSRDLRVYEAHYDAAIHEIDDQLGRILRRLEELDLLAGTLVVVTSDHGEEFLDHGSMSHGHSLYDELLRIPLIVYSREAFFAGRRVTSAASIVDLYPTLIDLMGWQSDDGLDELPHTGRSLMPALLGDGVPRPAPPLLMTHTSMPTQATDRLDAWIEDAWKLIRFQPEARFELYHLVRDPGERHDLAMAEPETVRHLALRLAGECRARERLRQRLARPVDRSLLGRQEEDALRALGYVE